MSSRVAVLNSNKTYAWFERSASEEWDAIVINRKRELDPDDLGRQGVTKIVIPHWSYIIPPEVYERFECILFHMTDLPYGRGGSPLQNLIARGHRQTQISALRVSQGLDTGPVYLKRPLALYGTAREVFLRAEKVMWEMAATIIEESLVPTPQIGEVVTFKRRTPDQGDVSGLDHLEAAYDHIRMLDADGYPSAFVEVGGFRFEFSRASLRHDSIVADVRITRR